MTSAKGTPTCPYVGARPRTDTGAHAHRTPVHTGSPTHSHLNTSQSTFTVPHELYLAVTLSAYTSAAARRLSPFMLARARSCERKKFSIYRGSRALPLEQLYE